MKNMNSIKKKSSGFIYPHPLIKNIQQTITLPKIGNLNQLTILPIYQNCTFDQNSKSEVSTKLLRVSKRKVKSQEKFGFLLQPFNSNQRVLMHQQDNVNLKCSVCNAFVNFSTKIESLYQIRCNICKQSNQVTSEIFAKKQNIGMFADICSGSKNQNILKQNFITKNVCFVLQASQQNYENQIQDIIISCINSIQQEQQQEYTIFKEDGDKSKQNFFCKLKIKFNIAFVLFDNKNVYIVNQKENNILAFQQSFLSNKNQNNNQNQKIINFDDFFVPIKNVTIQTFQLIKQFLYEAYLIKSTCLPFVVRFIQKVVDKFQTQKTSMKSQNSKIKIYFKFFITNIRANNSSKQVFQDQNSKISLFLDISNKSKDKDQKQKAKLQANEQSNILLSSNHQYFIIKSNKFQSKQYIKKLKSRIYRIYQSTPCKNTLFNQVYYDLYENIKFTKDYHDVCLKIITPHQFKLTSVGNANLGYEDCSSIKTKSNTKGIYNQFYTVFKNLNNNSTISIVAKIEEKNQFISGKNDMSLIQYPIQFQFQYFLNISNTQSIKVTRILNSKIELIYNNPGIGNCQHSDLLNCSSIDDETFFYFILKEVLDQCQKTKSNHTIRNKMTQKMKQIALSIKRTYKSILEFPKQLKHTFLYAFMALNRSFVNVKDFDFYYSRHLFIFSSMQEKVKKIYPRVYEIKNQKQQYQTEQIDVNNNLSIKNIKCCQTKFKANQITLFENGLNLYLVIGQDCSVQFLKQIFGTFIFRQISEFTQLPELQTNLKYREAIQKIRSLNESCYLRLKIIELFSPQFQTQIGPYLYYKDAHFDYMKHLWVD